MWSNRNHLTIHPIKTEAVILRKSAFIGPLPPPLYFGTGLINLVESTTCLGVNIDNRLSWSVHIDSIRKHFSQMVGALKRMRAFPKKMLEEIYFKAIVPSITYGISVWGNCQPSSLTSLNSLHTRASRIINNLQLSLADDACLAKSNWLPISYFYKRSALMLMRKVYFETSCQSICNLFSKRKISRSSRIQNQFDIIRFNSDTGRNTLQYRGPVIWNFLNRLVTVPERFFSFKHILRKHSRDINTFSLNKGASLIIATKKDDFVYF